MISALALLLGAGAGPATAQTTAPCATPGACVDLPAFLATVTGFRAGPAGMARSVSATIRFINKSPRRLVIGYVDGSGAATNGRGTRYAVRTAGIRGIGSISSSSFDPKFGMDPGASTEANIEFESPPGSRSDSAGTTWDIELTVREIDPVASNQYKLGKQYVLQFRGLKP